MAQPRLNPRDPETWVAEHRAEAQRFQERAARLAQARACLIESDPEHDLLLYARRNALAIVEKCIGQIRAVTQSVPLATNFPPWYPGDRRQWEAAKEDRDRADYYHPRKGPFDPQ